MDIFYQILVYLNIVLALLLIITSIIFILKFRGYITWIKGLQLFVGIYFLVVCILILFCGPIPNIVIATLRPGATLVLSTMAAGALNHLLVEYRR